jgi:putative transcriptional regulator
MSVRFHPSDETLARYAARTLSLGVEVVTAAHIAGCRHCTDLVGHFEAVGGALLDTMPETPVDNESLAHTFARIERQTEIRRQAKSAILKSPQRPAGLVLPHALDRYDAGPWRWLGPGIHMSRVKMPKDAGSTVILLRVAANTPMPEHGHEGTEYTQVLSGSLLDSDQCARAGDFVEAGDDMHHQPVAGPDSDCICLAAVDGRLRANSFIGQAYLSILGL